MHSVKKVEEKARIAREEKRKKKMIELDAVRKQIFLLSKTIDNNERVIMDLTEGVLTQIPDIYTFWVIRRQVLSHVKDKMEKDENFSILTNDESGRIYKKKEANRKKKEQDESIKAKDEEKLLQANDESLISNRDSTIDISTQPIENNQSCNKNASGDKESEEKKENEYDEIPSYPRPTYVDLIDREISLTETALLSNPKSYSAWNHRKWCIEQHDNPPLNKELILCEKALSFDCRNFHVWDYRRYIVKKLKRTMEDELNFVNDMVKKNPSNYSAWHYRISLLLEKGHKIDDEMFIQELKSIMENCVVNSEDQTAWTYVNWLIEKFLNDFKPKDKIDYLISFTDNQEVDNKKHSTFVFVDAVNKEFLKSNYLNDEEYELKPRLIGSHFDKTTVAYIWDVYGQKNVELTLNNDDLKRLNCVANPRRRYVNVNLLNQLLSSEPKNFLDSVKEIFNFFYDTCKELMKENEENNPWEIIAQAHVLPIINGINKNIEDQVNILLEKAKKADQQRCQMYDAMKDKCRIINMIHEKTKDGKTVLETLYEKEGKIVANFNDYSTLRLLAGLVRIVNKKEDINPQLVWFLPTKIN